MSYELEKKQVHKLDKSSKSEQTDKLEQGSELEQSNNQTQPSKLDKPSKPKRVYKSKRKFTKEFKLQAVELMLSNTMKSKEICKLLDIDRQTIHRWVKEYKANGEKAFDEKKAILPCDELNRLRKEIANLKLENEILKKAHAYFAKHPELG